MEDKARLQDRMYAIMDIPIRTRAQPLFDAHNVTTSLNTSLAANPATISLGAVMTSFPGNVNTSSGDEGEGDGEVRRKRKRNRKTRRGVKGGKKVKNRKARLEAEAKGEAPKSRQDTRRRSQWDHTKLAT